MSVTQSYDYVADVLDEIALEGLDGITLNTLWIRLSERKGFCLALDDSCKDFLWHLISIQHDLEFYELPRSRSPLVLFNRYDHRDPETGMCLEVNPNDAPLDIYPIKTVDNKAYRGSCATFDTRKLVSHLIRNKDTPLLSYCDVMQKYEDTLVVVASQKVRTRLLLGESCDPQLEISNMQYTMLEIIYRSRHHGVVTTGQVCSYSGLKESPKSLFYHRKLLIKKQLIRRQLHFQRNKVTTQWGFVFHAPRFYTERPTAVHLMLQKLCNILQMKPQQQELFTVLRNEASIPDTTFKKILARGQPLAQFTDVSLITYYEMYPEKKVKVSKSGKKGNKTVKVVKLLKPFSWNALNEEPEDHDDDEEDGDAEAPDIDSSRLMMIRPIVCQAYDMLYRHSPEGMSERELQKAMGLSKLDARSICRYLTRSSVVATYMRDKGRQRMTMYVIAEHLHLSQAHQSILEERQKYIDSENLEEKSFIEAVQAAEETSDPIPLPGRVVRHIDLNQSESVVSSGVLEQEGQFVGETISDNANQSVLPNSSDAGFDVNDKNLTVRQLSRANFILDMVRKQVFIDDIYKVQRALSEKETKEGCPTRLARKTVQNIVEKLAKDGFIKSMHTSLKLGNDVKKLHYVCVPEVTQSHPLVQAAIQSAKRRLVGLKYTETRKIYQAVKKPDKNKDETSAGELTDRQGDLNQEAEPSLTKHDWQDKTAEMTFKKAGGRHYGLLPKFCRASILHELLFYIVFENEGTNTAPVTNILIDGVMVIADECTEMSSNEPTIYSERKDWRMFIPPLHSTDAGFPSGWCLISDILQRLPISIFMQIVNTPFKIEGLEEYLDHPIKQHYLVNDLPTKIRNSLLMSRRYVFYINNILVTLCHMGLVTFGPQIHKDKDQVYICLHRLASVMDTTISEPGHYTISDQDYSWRFHLLNSMFDVQNYWLDMKTVCLNTPLGRKYSEKVNISVKPDLNKALESKTVEEFVDDGKVPGDNKGAGGLDSSLCSYLKRNWASSQVQVGKSLNTALSKKLAKEKEKANPIPLSKLLQEGYNVTTMERKQRLNRLTKQTSLSSSRSDDSGTLTKNFVIPMSMEQNYNGPKNAPKFSIMPEKEKVKTSNRKGKQIKSRYSGHRVLDPKDKAALASMQRQRATFTSQEDTFFLLCKVASVLMGTKHLAVTSVILRDEHQKHCPKALLKTSKACLRRYNALYKNSKMKDTTAVMLLETQQDMRLQSLLKTPDFVKGSQEWNEKYQAILKELISIFNEKKSTSFVTLPDTWEEFQENYMVTILSKDQDAARTDLHVNPKNIVDVQCNVIFNIILVSVSSLELQTNWSYHLFRLYQQYPENLLRAVISRMRKDRIISSLKCKFGKKVEEIVYSAHPYRLSISFKNTLLTRFQTEIFDDGYEMYQLLANASETADSFVPLAPTTVEGYGMAMQALIAAKMIILRTEIPDQILDVQESNEPGCKRMKLSRTFQKLVSPNESSEMTFSMVDPSQLLPASRLGLHLMRKQIFSAPALKNVQHSADLFVMNSCDVYGRLKSQIFPPFSDGIVKQWLQPSVVDTEHVTSILEFCFNVKVTGEEREKIIAVYETIREENVQGVSQSVLGDIADDLSLSAAELIHILKMLCQHSMIVRVGVQSYVYVAITHIAPWLMRTLVIPKEKKAIISFADDAADEGSSKEPHQNTSQDDDDVMIITDQPTTSSDVTQNKGKSRKSETSEFIPSFSEDECVKVDVICKPWHKPDGYINKKMLYSLLESTACYIAQNPGVSEKNIFDHFNPYLQPIHILDVLEMLMETECIKKININKMVRNRGPFFSCSYLSTREEVVDSGFEAYYEPQVDILMRVARLKHIFKAKESNQ